jgi:Peptidase family S41
MKKVKENYAGFGDKVNKNNEKNYVRFCEGLRKKSVSASGIACFNLMLEYVSYFRDIHLNVNLKIPETDTAMIQKFYANAPRYIFDTTRFLLQLKNNGNSIQGIWNLNTRNSKYRVAIIKKTAREYLGVILEGDGLFWKKWDVKFHLYPRSAFRYYIKYLQKDHTLTEEEANFENRNYVAIAGNIWTKSNPINNADTVQIKKTRMAFRFDSLSPSTNLLALPNFRLESKDKIDSLLSINSNLLNTTPNLIIDMRNNAGGTIYSFNKLFDLFYTKPIYFESGLYKSSTDNIAHYKQKLVDTSLTAQTRDDLIDLINKLEKAPGKMVAHGNSTPYVAESALAYPQKIAVLVNYNCKSAAEFFLMLFRQSKKLIILGQTTQGAADYVNMILDQPLPCPYFKYGYALVKRNGAESAPIDNKGIKPDITLTAPDAEWINIARKYLEANN